MKLTRTAYPSVGLPAWCEKFELTNTDSKVAFVELPELSYTTRTEKTQGTEGSYTVTVSTVGGGAKALQPNETVVFYMTISGTKEDQDFGSIDPEKELQERKNLLNTFKHKLVLETPDSIINNAFAFAKIRAAESIFQTKGGPMHGPGGLRYYAAIWANDQAEYINPFFPFLGYDYGIESAINAFKHFARFMNDQYKPIPSSIIAEGTDIWDGAGDRGDAAMIAYGAARFALTLGSRSTANELWPLIEWCLEFNRRKLNANGVVNSDSDELEGRFPAGNANLCTSSLYYDALVSSMYLGQALGKDKQLIASYKKQADELKKNIEKFFGAQVMGYNTYRYYEGNDILRSWICIPLTVGIYERRAGTIDALFSEQLWTADGLATQSGDRTFWDRSTLYALRGVFAAGETERGLKFLNYYSQRRLLGDHVPYPVEAYPEGNQRHLSAESALYCRIFTEGLFGIRPTGLTSFTVTPQLPDGWSFMSIKNINGFNKVFDVVVKREGTKVRVTIQSAGKILTDKQIDNGTPLNVKFHKFLNR
jgi:hypothetical protein